MSLTFYAGVARINWRWALNPITATYTGEIASLTATNDDCKRRHFYNQLKEQKRARWGKEMELNSLLHSYLSRPPPLSTSTILIASWDDGKRGGRKDWRKEKAPSLIWFADVNDFAADWMSMGRNAFVVWYGFFYIC